MKTVPLFDVNLLGDVFTERQSRNLRAGKTLFQLVTKGAKSLNAAAIWMDAASSVMDCIGAYLRYQQAKEITEQLESQKEALDKQIENCQKILQVEQQVWQEEQQNRLEALDAILRRDRQSSVQLLHVISGYRNSIDFLFVELTKIRHKPHARTPELLALVNSVDKLMQAQLSCLVAAFDEPNP
ncbi:hypothetical protein UA45_01505 [Morganella morganii]|uniref:Uncharacterized protein n=1 Tax=Morganella morganii TaxID=582 RepID=A0A0D8LB91_MORMO|nr:hypothetical protein UA45_01505 [Morganella morganii]